MKIGLIIIELFRGSLHNIKANKRAPKRITVKIVFRSTKKIWRVYDITVLDFVDIIASVFHSHSRRNNKNV